MRVKTIAVIYDGRCGFCIRALNVVRALDALAKLSFYDAHRKETFERFPVLSWADVDDAMYAIAEGEQPYRGFFAFRRLVWTSPLTWALLPLFYFPGASIVGPIVYGWVARNRSRFGCGSEVCALPATTTEGRGR
jgi:predicted DCC family thiol-disulfide oxidoreductase YuxK